ncbi:unnamed protein product [Pedinophyceae sp. YPF-701]|nr:unnamed protein product [Pedinophyceae sp. YPF-701]
MTVPDSAEPSGASGGVLGGSLQPTTSAASGQTAKKKSGGQRKTPAQLAVLEAHFATDKNPSKGVRENLAAETGLEVEQVARWFQTRRKRERDTKAKEAVRAQLAGEGAAGEDEKVAAGPAIVAPEVAAAEQTAASLAARAATAADKKEAARLERERAKLEKQVARQRERLEKARVKEEARLARERERAEARMAKAREKLQKQKAKEEQRAQRGEEKGARRGGQGGEGRAAWMGGRRPALPDDLELEAEELKKRHQALVQAQLERIAGGAEPTAEQRAQALASVPAPTPVELPPAYLEARPLAESPGWSELAHAVRSTPQPPPTWTDSDTNVFDTAAGGVFFVWSIVSTFGASFGAPACAPAQLAAAFVQGQASPLLSGIAVGALRSVAGDAERCAASGAAQAGALSADADRRAAYIGLEARAWGLDPAAWEGTTDALTWPEILRQVALASGAGPRRRGAGRGKGPAWTAHGVGAAAHVGASAVGGAFEDLVDDGAGGKRLECPRRFRAGSIKHAMWHVLSKVGPEGMRTRQIVREMRNAGLASVTKSKTPEVSVNGAALKDSVFHKVKPGVWALSSVVKGSEAGGSRRGVEGHDGSRGNATSDKAGNQDDAEKGNDGAHSDGIDSSGTDTDNEETEGHTLTRRWRHAPWAANLLRCDFDDLPVLRRIEAIEWLCQLLLEVPTVRAELDAREEEAARLRRIRLEESRRLRGLSASLAVQLDAARRRRDAAAGVARQLGAAGVNVRAPLTQDAIRLAGQAAVELGWSDKVESAAGGARAARQWDERLAAWMAGVGDQVGNAVRAQRDAVDATVFTAAAEIAADAGGGVEGEAAAAAHLSRPDVINTQVELGRRQREAAAAVRAGPWPRPPDDAAASTAPSAAQLVAEDEAAVAELESKERAAQAELDTLAEAINARLASSALAVRERELGCDRRGNRYWALPTGVHSGRRAGVVELPRAGAHGTRWLALPEPDRLKRMAEDALDDRGARESVLCASIRALPRLAPAGAAVDEDVPLPEPPLPSERLRALLHHPPPSGVTPPKEDLRAGGVFRDAAVAAIARRLRAAAARLPASAFPEGFVRGVWEEEVSAATSPGALIGCLTALEAAVGGGDWAHPSLIVGTPGKEQPVVGRAWATRQWGFYDFMEPPHSAPPTGPAPWRGVRLPSKRPSAAAAPDPAEPAAEDAAGSDAPPATATPRQRHTLAWLPETTAAAAWRAAFVDSVLAFPRESSGVFGDTEILMAVRALMPPFIPERTASGATVAYPALSSQAAPLLSDDGRVVESVRPSDAFRRPPLAASSGPAHIWSVLGSTPEMQSAYLTAPSAAIDAPLPHFAFPALPKPQLKLPPSALLPKPAATSAEKKEGPNQEGGPPELKVRASKELGRSRVSEIVAGDDDGLDEDLDLPTSPSSSEHDRGEPDPDFDADMDEGGLSPDAFAESDPSAELDDDESDDDSDVSEWGGRSRRGRNAKKRAAPTRRSARGAAAAPQRKRPARGKQQSAEVYESLSEASAGGESEEDFDDASDFSDESDGGRPAKKARGRGAGAGRAAVPAPPRKPPASADGGGFDDLLNGSGKPAAAGAAPKLKLKTIPPPAAAPALPKFKIKAHVVSAKPAGGRRVIDSDSDSDGDAAFEGLLDSE